jgi:hypothetical protein
MFQARCLVSSNWNRTLGNLKKRGIYLEVEGVAARVNGKVVEIGWGVVGSWAAESKAWYLYPVYLISFSPLQVSRAGRWGPWTNGAQPLSPEGITS